MSKSTPPPGSHRSPARRTPPSAAYHDDLPDIFEALPPDPHMLWAIEYMGIETPGELIDDAPVILPGDGGLRRVRRDDPAPYRPSLPAEPGAHSRSRGRSR